MLLIVGLGKLFVDPDATCSQMVPAAVTEYARNATVRHFQAQQMQFIVENGPTAIEVLTFH
jgi:hypothetical protein